MRLGLLVLANTLIERRWCNRAYLPAVQADMRECMARSKSMGDAEKREAFPAKVAAWNSSLEALQKASTDAAVFLAKYDVRQAESRVGMVRELLEEARAQVSQPLGPQRRSFAVAWSHPHLHELAPSHSWFHARSLRFDDVVRPAARVQPPRHLLRRKQKQMPLQAVCRSARPSCTARAPDVVVAMYALSAADSCSKFDVPEKSFEHRTGETLVVRPGELCGADASESVDFRLTHLEDCVVFLYVHQCSVVVLTPWPRHVVCIAC